MKREKIELTDIEEIVKRGLDTLGIKYIIQYPTRTGFILDFAILDKMIDLEVDDVYHDNPKTQKRDRFRTYLLKGEGWKTVRIHHTKINKDNIADVLKEKLG